MEFSLSRSLEILEKTPAVLSALLTDLSGDWTLNNEGGETWSAFDVVGHLIHGEKANWLPRAQIILSGRADKNFEPFDRVAGFETNRMRTLEDLLGEFAALRRSNIEMLKGLEIRDDDLSGTGNHPALGTVTLRELLSTWVVHDLSHIAQISRILAKQYGDQVGPFSTYLGILNR